MLWANGESGHWLSMGPDGMRLNGKPVSEPPEWFEPGRAPDMVFGPMLPWSGGECPVNPDTVVRAVFRGRRPYIGRAIWPELPERGKASMWRHAPCAGRHNPAYDIIGYQEALS